MIRSRKETGKTETVSLRGQSGVMGKVKGACPENESLSEILKSNWECNLKKDI